MSRRQLQRPRRQSRKAWLSELTNDLYRRFYMLPQRQRLATLRALDKVSATNCDWTLYVMRDALREFIAASSTSRATTRRGTEGPCPLA